MAPSGVQKERMRPEDMFVLDAKGDVLETPEARPPPYPAPKLSECSPLFMAVSGAGQQRGRACSRGAGGGKGWKQEGGMRGANHD